jgi:hypothetical protein
MQRYLSVYARRQHITIFRLVHISNPSKSFCNSKSDRTRSKELESTSTIDYSEGRLSARLYGDKTATEILNPCAGWTSWSIVEDDH